MTANPAQQDALTRIVELMDEYGLKPSDVRHAARKNRAAKQAAATGATRADTVMRLFTYIGGAFIFAGLGIFISMIWDELGSLPRVIITLGSGIVAFLLGLIFAKNPRFERAATPAFLLAFLLQPTGLFVMLREYAEGDNAALASLIVFGVLTVQQGLTFAALKRTALLLFTLIYFLGFYGGAVENFELHRAFSTLVVGAFYFFLTVDLLKRPAYRDLTPFLFLIGAPMLLAGLYYFTGNTVYDPANLSVALFMLMISVLQNSRTLYFLSVLFVLSYLASGPGGGWISWGQWTMDWAAIISGASVVLAGLWLRRADHVATTPIWLFCGMGIALTGAFAVLYQTPLEIFCLAISTLAIFISLKITSRAALAVSVLSLVGYVSYFSNKHFADIVGWPILMILLGFMMLGAGMAFVKLSKKLAAAA